MKRSVQILLLFACLAPLLAGAREETMEERKRRITRKYLRERAEVTYSEAAVPDAYAEDDEVLSSEKFKQPQVDLQRQKSVATIPPPARRPVPRTENSNWLLSENPELDNPHADPFARKEAKDEPKKKADWTTWGTERGSSPYPGIQRESQFNWRDQGSSFGQQPDSYDSVRQGAVNPRDPRTYSSGGVQPDFQQQGGRISGSIGGLDLSREKTFNSALNQGRLQSPFPREAKPASDRSFGSGSRQQRQGGYTPYKSPYQTQREQRQQHPGGYNAPKQEFQRQNTFQQWKEKNPVQFDPTSDDAFIEEMMPRTRR